MYVAGKNKLPGRAESGKGVSEAGGHVSEASRSTARPSSQTMQRSDSYLNAGPPSSLCTVPKLQPQQEGRFPPFVNFRLGAFRASPKPQLLVPITSPSIIPLDRISSSDRASSP